MIIGKVTQAIVICTTLKQLDQISSFSMTQRRYESNTRSPLFTIITLMSAETDPSVPLWTNTRAEQRR